MNRIFTILSLLLLLGLASCNGSKALTKKGVKLEEAGMIDEASDKYFLALKKKRNNLDAQIGMKNTGQLILNRYLADFSSKKTFGDKREAIDAFHKAQQFQSKIKTVGVTLDIAEFYNLDYEGVKLEYLDELYEEATLLLEQEKYNQAELKFKEIASLDPDFKDSSDLQDIAYVEPLYQSGLQNLDMGLFRSAFEDFDKIKNRVGVYKDGIQYRDEALTLGRFPIAIFPFENGTPENGIDAKMSAYALEALSSVNDPFLSIVDRDNLALILEEQQLSMTGIFNEESALNVGELTGAKAILTGTVLDYSFEISKIKSFSRKGFEKYKVKRTDSEGNVTYETKYREVNYKEYTNSATVYLSVQYKLVSLETGEVLSTKISEKQNSDNVRYVIYDGDRKIFYPAKSNGQVNTSSSARNTLFGLMDSRRKLMSKTELAGGLFDAQKNAMSSMISNELKKLIQ